MSNHHNSIGICLVCILLFSCLLVISSNSTAAQQTPTDQSDVLWSTTIPWNLADTPAQGMQDSEISHKYRSWTTPVIANGVLYAGATSEVQGIGNGRFMGPIYRWINVYAFNAASGKQIWSFQANFYQVTDLAVSDGKVFFGARADDNYLGDIESALYALNADKGDILWTAKCPYVSGVPAVDDGAVLVASLYSLRAFNETNGKDLWTFTPSDLVFSMPETYNGTVLISSNDHTLYAINATDGAKLWSLTNEVGFSSVTAANGVVYVPSDDGNIYALDVISGSRLWNYATMPPEFSWANDTWHTTPLYDNGVLYFTCQSMQHIHISKNGLTEVCQMAYRTSVVALDADTGNRIWNYTVPTSQFDSALSIADGIIFTENNRSVMGFNSQNGALIWNYTHADLWPQTQTTVANGALYVGTSDGQIYALQLTELGIQSDDINDFLSQAADSALLTIAVFAITSALLTSVLLYRKKRSKR